MIENEFFNCYARSLPYLIEKASVYIRARGSLLLNEFGADITLEQFITLDAIYTCPGLCQRDLAKILLKDRSNVSRILNILENKKLIVREPVTKGNRVVKSSKLTPKGKELIVNLSDKMKSDFDSFLLQFNQNDLRILEKTLNEISLKISEKAKLQI